MGLATAPIFHPLLDMIASAFPRFETMLRTAGRYSLLLFDAFRSPAGFRRNLGSFRTELVRTGIDSIPLVALASAFIGAVTTVQTLYQIVSPLLPKSVIGAVVVPSVLMELGAAFMALLLAGRVGARIAAELGTMRVSEQIDALDGLGLDSASYLVAPRVVAGMLMFPVLYVVSCTVAIVSGAVASELSGVPASLFMQGARQAFNSYDVLFGLTKAFVFGFAVTSVACYSGYYTSGGAEGVGRSTTQAVVAGCVFVLIADYVLAATLL
jgi:phospholipid/cholesterol/gamma-HCH transport system permease protein